MTIIEVNNLCFGYGKKWILKDLSFEVENGAFLAIAGPNGVGKSTLLSLLSGLLKAQSGMIKIDPNPTHSYSIQKLAAKIAVVRQDYTPSFGFSVLETVLMARTIYFGRSGFENEIDRDIVMKALKATEILDLSSRLLDRISGGERQRAFIARALAQDSPILLLDEPTSFLDLQHQVKIYDLLKQLQTDKG